MIETINELKETLNLKTIQADWNDNFPLYMLDSTYRGTNIHQNILALESELHEQGTIKITRQGLYKVGLLAEIHNLIFAYIITDATTIEFFFYQKIQTNEWLDIFKQHLSRKQFFNTIKSYKNIKPYTSMFDVSTYYQLCAPDTPPSYNKTTITKINNDYILIQYNHDYFAPTYRVVKIGKQFEMFKPVLTYKYNAFDSLTLKVDGKEFKTDSTKRFIYETEKEKKLITHFDGVNTYYHLDPETAELKIISKDDGFEQTIQIEKFKRDPHTKVILAKEYKNKQLILLSNGFVWNVQEDSFTNLKTIEGLEDLNTEILSMSSKEKGIVLSLDPNSIELVPTVVFEKFLFKHF